MSGKVKSGVASAGGVAPKPGRSWRRSIQAVRPRSADLGQGELEIARIRLVAAELLGRDHPVETNPEALVRAGKEVRVAVRDHAQLEARGEAGQGVDRVGEGGPVADRFREPLDLVGSRIDAELAGDAHKGPGQDRPVLEVRASLGRRLEPGERLEELVVSGGDATLVEDLMDCGQDPALPVDQGPVAVERDDVEVRQRRGRHEQPSISRPVCLPASLRGTQKRPVRDGPGALV
jgi:hypothetical protein